MTREKVDFIIHIPLEAEYIEFREVFSVIEEFQDELNVIVRVKAPSGFNAVAIVQQKMGRSSASNACQKALRMFEPRAYICLGIAGGLSKDLKLGDVCYTGMIADVYDNSKITDAKGGGVNIALSPDFYHTDSRLTAAVGFVRTLTSLSELHSFWKDDQQNFISGIVPQEVVGRDDKLERIGTPKCLNGDIVCGAVSESDAYRERLQGVTRNILAIETESGPIFEQCRAMGVPALTIRGISDYANASKGKLEGETKEAIRRVAARNAVSFLHMQMQSPIFIQALATVCGGGTQEPELDLREGGETESIPGWLSKIEDEVDTKLRELSPQFRTKPLGFKLPAPRVKRAVGAAASDPKKRPRALEFQNAVSRHRRMTIYVPRTYPDQALPWILASSLLQADIGGKKVIPIVLDGRKLGPPRDDFSHLASLNLDRTIGQQGGEYVFIIDEPSFTSKSKVDYLVKQIKEWDDARVVFVTRRDRAVVEAAEFTRQLSADAFSLCDVSFSEMAAFIEASFEVPGHEAEVVALKLKGMFESFELPAHPSFFAGIPSEALAALLLANRRSELIQLAVDGFLSFVVASDTDQVRMSRSNRAKFLRRLAVETIYEKRTFDEPQLVHYAKEISDEFDYGLNPIAFVQSFVSAGLIHFEDGKASITLPFIESYLFADEMSKRPKLANHYLQSMGDDPDLSIFDLYAEIGPSKESIDGTVLGLDAAIKKLPTFEGPHMLLGGTVNPVILRNPARLNNLSQKVSEARTAVAEGARHRDEKARILDIADRVNEDVAERANPDQDKPEETTEYQQQVLVLTKRWTLASILLGSGAESINGPDRKLLAETIICGGDVLLDAFLRNIATIDFENVKREIVSGYRSAHQGETELGPEFESLVSAVVDLIEFVAFTDPLNRVFDLLPDQARHRIVGNSVEKAKTVNTVQEMIKLNWLANINPGQAKGPLLKAIHNLPDVQFLRASLTSIYMMRVKWKVADLDTRMALLDAAEEAIRPFNPHLDKGEILRFVERHVPGTSVAEDDAL